jgi:hypothetical protein
MTTTFVIFDRPVQAEGIRKDDTCLNRWQGRENEPVQRFRAGGEEIDNEHETSE